MAKIIGDHLVYTGNAFKDGEEHGGWFIGRFMPVDKASYRGMERNLGGPLAGDFEVKIHNHLAGEQESRNFPFNLTATTMSLLVGFGHFIIKFRHEGATKEVELMNDGDFVIWQPGVAHSWEVLAYSTIFTVRSPSVLNDQRESP